MKYSILFDKLGYCAMCQHSAHKADTPTIGPCVWCERNIKLYWGIKDYYNKIEEQPVEEMMGTIGIEDDSDPVKDANKEFLGGLLNPGSSLSKKKRGKNHGTSS